MQASSCRKITQDDKDAFRELTKRAFKNACTFVSATTVSYSPDSIKQDLHQWFSTVGSSLLCSPDSGDGTFDDDMADEVLEDDEVQELDEESDEEPEIQESVCQAIEASESDLVMLRELKKAQKETDERTEFVETADFVPDMGSEDEADTTEPNSKKKKSSASVKTLNDVLTESGLIDFKPEEDDAESNALQRVRTMTPYLRMFSAYTMCGGKILSKASVAGHFPEPRDQWIFEKELAAARAQYHCTAMRQSRHSLWAQYSERVQEVIQELKEEGDAHAAEGAVEVKIITPNVYQLNEKRVCQVLVVRPFKAGGTAGPLRLAVVIAAWRGGKQGKRSKQYPWTEGSLPSYACTRFHARMLKPENEQDADGWELCTATNLSPVFSLDPSDESLVMEVPGVCIKYEYHENALKVWVAKAAIRAIKKVSKSSVAFHDKKSKQEQQTSTNFSRFFITFYDFLLKVFFRFLCC